MWVQVISPFIDLQHGKIRRKLHDKWNEKVIRANELAAKGFVKKITVKKKPSGS